jgi:hypothetical protein
LAWDTLNGGACLFGFQRRVAFGADVSDVWKFRDVSREDAEAIGHVAFERQARDGSIFA